MASLLAYSRAMRSDSSVDWASQPYKNFVSEENAEMQCLMWLRPFNSSYVSVKRSIAHSLCSC